MTKKNHTNQLKMNKKDKLNENDKEWLLELYYSLQRSALKALRLSNNKHMKQPSESTKIPISKTQIEFIAPMKQKWHCRSLEAITNNNYNNSYISRLNVKNKNDCLASYEELPPAPPPRMITSAPPPLPPLPLHLLKETTTSEATLISRHPAPSPSYSPKLNDNNLNLNESHQTQGLFESIFTSQQHDCRNSPSSGFYSCSTSAGSSSPVFNISAKRNDNVPTFNGTQNVGQPMILHSVKSIQVEKPQLQTAIAPTSYIAPPPYRNSSPRQTQRASAGICHVIPVPSTKPPSYASTMQSFLYTSSSASNICKSTTFFKEIATGTGNCSTDTFEKCKKPPLPLPILSSEKDNTSPWWEADIDELHSSTTYSSEICKQDEKRRKIDHQSPIPERKTNAEQENNRKDCKVRNYSPQAFKFYMEQHIENVMKSHKQRMYRRIQLEKEMVKIGLSLEAQCQMRKMLCQKESNYIRLKRAKMCKSMFEKIKLIGVGAFGEVTLVRKFDTNQLYAMKTLRKADVLKKNQVAHVKAERDILAEADNEWVVKLYFSFQDIDNLYFVMEYIPGGDLMSLLIKMGIFEENLARFYLAELTCAVESVHKIKFIHRDIKPDNILIDRYGHIKLTDFGLCTGFRWTHNSKYYENDHNRQDSLDLDEKVNDVNCRCFKLKPLERRRRREHQRCLAHSLVGTPNYIAPEVLLRTGYTQLCDWWSVGVVLYEMLVGSPPFSADTPNETQRKIISWQNTLKIPTNANLSAEAVDLITKLCTSAEKRLGKNADEVKAHPFFSGIDFRKDIRSLVPPYIPKINFSTDTSNFDDIDLESMSSDESSDSSSTSFVSNSNRSFHGFFEFTFRRFFDDVGGGVPFSVRDNHEEQDNHAAVYV